MGIRRGSVLGILLLIFFVLLVLLVGIVLLAPFLLGRRLRHGLNGLLDGLIISLCRRIPGVELESGRVTGERLLPLFALLVRILLGLTRAVAGISQIVPALLLQLEVGRTKHLLEQPCCPSKIIHAIGGRACIEAKAEIIRLFLGKTFVLLPGSGKIALSVALQRVIRLRPDRHGQGDQQEGHGRYDPRLNHRSLR